MSQLREGDIHIFNTDSGGEISVINGEPEMDGGLSSAAYLSLFGGDGSDYWANEYLTESEKMTGAFIGFILANAKTISTLRRAEKFARQDLKWFTNDGIADTINVEIISQSRQAIDLNVEILANGDEIFKNKYEINWGIQLAEPSVVPTFFAERPVKVLVELLKTITTADVKLTPSGDRKFAVIEE